jgi:hypothetical protein
MSRGRPAIILCLICSFILAGFGRQWAWQARAAAVVNPLSETREHAAQPGEGLGNMNSYALALLLGGLRGPLVMFLWSSSESQKTAHDLEDFDTKVEWIRLLQPEFDSVHLFQIWNKAYNVSVQMANLGAKYSAILDGLDYGASVNRQKPDDINIICAVGDLFGTKLSGMQLPRGEKEYYEQRIMQDTQAAVPLTRVSLPDARLPEFLAAARAAGLDQSSDALEQDDLTQTVSVTLPKPIADQLAPAFSSQGIAFTDLPMARKVVNASVRRNHLDPMLAPDGTILPELLTVTHPRPPGMSDTAQWYDGSELQYLKTYQPLPYGIPAEALGYNEFKRCQSLQRVDHESHIQLSPFVIDSRPSLSLEAFGHQEGNDGRRAELRYFGQDDSGDFLDIQLRAPAASGQSPAQLAQALANRPDPGAGPRALYDYALAARVYRDATAELRGHIQLYPNSQDRMASHLDDTLAFAQLYQADHDFLAGLMNAGDKSSAWASAADEYKQAAYQFELTVLRYFVEDDLAAAVYPKDARGLRLRRDAVDQLPPEQRRPILDAVEAASPDFYKSHPNDLGDDRSEYVNYINRCLARIRAMGAN